MNSNVDKFLEKSKKWKPEMEKLRAILLKSKLEEDFKWRAISLGATSTASFSLVNSSNTSAGSFSNSNLTSASGTGFTYGYYDLSLPIGTYYLSATTTSSTKSFTSAMPITGDVSACGAYSTLNVPMGPYGTATNSKKFYFFAYHDLDANGAFDKNTENIYPLTGGTFQVSVNGTVECTLGSLSGEPNPSACGYQNQGANKKKFALVGDASALGYVPTTPLNFTRSRLATGGVSGFGFAKKSAISGVVFKDANGDGYHNLQEPGLAGVTVTLTDSSNVQTTTVTNSRGYYEFIISSSGKYTVEETDPAGYASVSPNVVIVDANTSGNKTVNFADVLAGKINGYVFSDLNGHQRMQTIEPRIGGVLISLLNSSDLLVASTRSDADGSFSFDVLPGGYKVVETVPYGYKETSPTTVSTYIAAGSGATVVFGNISYGTIINYLFDDRNANGIADSSEVGIMGMQLTLTSTSTNQSYLTTGDGIAPFYLLAAPRTYTATAPSLTDYTSTAPSLTQSYALGSADAKFFYFGYTLSDMIVGTVFNDANQNATRDRSEGGAYLV